MRRPIASARVLLMTIAALTAPRGAGAAPAERSDPVTWFLTHASEFSCSRIRSHPRSKGPWDPIETGHPVEVSLYDRVFSWSGLDLVKTSSVTPEDCAAKAAAAHIGDLRVLVVISREHGLETIKVSPKRAYETGVASCVEDVLIPKLLFARTPWADVFSLDEKGRWLLCLLPERAAKVSTQE
jgi:hypothetical protein